MILDSFLALCAWFMVDLGFSERLNKIINATNQQHRNNAQHHTWLYFYTINGFMQEWIRKDFRVPK
jgi:hypothetical protein